MQPFFNYLESVENVLLESNGFSVEKINENMAASFIQSLTFWRLWWVGKQLAKRFEPGKTKGLDGYHQKFRHQLWLFCTRSTGASLKHCPTSV